MAANRQRNFSISPPFQLDRLRLDASNLSTRVWTTMLRHIHNTVSLSAKAFHFSDKNPFLHFHNEWKEPETLEEKGITDEGKLRASLFQTDPLDTLFSSTSTSSHALPTAVIIVRLALVHPPSWRQI